jgi:Ca2+-transporting ATPase
VADEFKRLALLGLRAQDDAWYRSRGGRAGSFTTSLEEALADDGSPPLLDPDELRESEPAGGSHPYTRTIASSGSSVQQLILGAPEAVLALTAEAISGSETERWRALVADHAGAGRRLLLLAGGDVEQPPTPLGLFAFSDPLRSDVPVALAMATAAGIQTIVVTGDHPMTAIRIATGAGLPAGTTLTGDELESWDDDRLARELSGLRLVARALPEQKLRLVEAARRLGRTVAVTGDGVNDAPALEHADVAVAMGSGSAVAREASDLVLGDDSFATLMGGLREGRRMVANIQKGLVFLVSTHVALLGFILIATIYGVSQPLLPLHILWLEFFIDVSASIAFEREPEEPDMMQRPPRPRNRPLLTRDLLLRITAAGGWTALGALFIIATHPGGPDHARWVAFNALVFGQVIRAYANRSLTRPVLSLPPNLVMLGVGLVVLAVQLAIPHIPVLAEAFQAAPLDAEDLLVVGIVALAPAIVAEIVRGTRHRTWVA